jgi:hypothetical protein
MHCCSASVSFELQQVLFRPARPKGRFLINAATYPVNGGSSLSAGCSVSTHRKSRRKLTMATNSSPLTDVLHSENHSKLSSEEIAKALARHNKNRSAAKAENVAAKTTKPTKK